MRAIEWAGRELARTLAELERMRSNRNPSFVALKSAVEIAAEQDLHRYVKLLNTALTLMPEQGDQANVIPFTTAGLASAVGGRLIKFEVDRDLEVIAWLHTMEDTGGIIVGKATTVMLRHPNGSAHRLISIDAARLDIQAREAAKRKAVADSVAEKHEALQAAFDKDRRETTAGVELDYTTDPVSLVATDTPAAHTCQLCTGGLASRAEVVTGVCNTCLEKDDSDYGPAVRDERSGDSSSETRGAVPAGDAGSSGAGDGRGEAVPRAASEADSVRDGHAGEGLGGQAERGDSRADSGGGVGDEADVLQSYPETSEDRD